jgi:hypothetical protein
MGARMRLRCSAAAAAIRPRAGTPSRQARPAKLLLSYSLATFFVRQAAAPVAIARVRSPSHAGCPCGELVLVRL